MELVKPDHLQELITSFANKDVYINAGAFIRNIIVKFELGKVAGDSPHRIGLKLPSGWIYAQGITHYKLDEHGRLLMAGLGSEGKLAVALEISETPFTY